MERYTCLEIPVTGSKAEILPLLGCYSELLDMYIGMNIHIGRAPACCPKSTCQAITCDVTRYAHPQLDGHGEGLYFQRHCLKGSNSRLVLPLVSPSHVTRARLWSAHCRVFSLSLSLSLSLLSFRERSVPSASIKSLRPRTARHPQVVQYRDAPLHGCDTSQPDLSHCPSARALRFSQLTTPTVTEK